MNRRLPIAAALIWLLAAPVSGQPRQQQALAQRPTAAPATYELSVQGPKGAYRTTAWVLPVGRITVFGLDPDDGASGKSQLPFAYDLADLGRMKPRATVINGGFSGAGPSRPTGLLLVAGRVVSPLGRAKYADGRYRLSAILCQTSSGGVSLLRTADVVSARESLLSRCASAIQAGPFVVENGHSGIGPAELSGRAYLRTMIALDASGRPCIVVFTRPVHLFAAAEFLSAPASASGGVVILTRTPSGLRASRGLGLRTVMNLDGDTSTALVHRGERIVGDPSLPRPSAIVIE